MSVISDSTKIIIQLKDTFDYTEYVNICKLSNVKPDLLGLFLQKAGMVEGAKRLNPANVTEGYLSIVTKMNAAYVPAKQPVSLERSPEIVRNGCNGCGGGKVR